MPTDTPKKINLALQGGGSHGAFTWGVLDRLLDEDDRLKIEGISGTSAGAMNAAILLQGYDVGGAKGAKESLDTFWHAIGKLSSFSLPQRTPYDVMMGNWNVDASPVAQMMDAWQRMFSPYQTNPFNYNPLRDLLTKTLDIKTIRESDTIKIFICATNVETGRPRIFERKELTVDAVLASSCLPFNFQAVMIDGLPYWDGGYVGNPSIFPLIYECQSPDVVLVQINPLERKGTPDTPTEIINRLNEISFNSALVGEMRAIAFIEKLVENDHLKSEEAARLKKMNIHMIGAEDKMSALGAASKSNAQMDFLEFLKDLGRTTAEKWLEQNWDFIGEKSSIDIHKTFL
ncbi:MAG TPA: patatin-like phospholipase family protein [Alphaproteobacteria bacterium]|nr:patatin-like phospholipase family protein [Alphaproteobacteria bacterium]